MNYIAWAEACLVRAEKLGRKSAKLVCEAKMISDSIEGLLDEKGWGDMRIKPSEEWDGAMIE